MKKYIITLIVIAAAVFSMSCSSDEGSGKNFILNVNGIDYTYKVYGSYASVTSEDNYRYTELYGVSDETTEFASCIIGYFYKVNGDGTYLITDYSTLSQDVHQETDNKYLYLQVSLGSVVYEVANDKNIVRYGSSNAIGTVDVDAGGGNYKFKLDKPVTLGDTHNSVGTPPTNAPSSIIVHMPNAYM
ncbi:hypothetical protein [Dysgonomonas sp. 25]|uniref:hypothetical protein n=1 Tax=Dysgonomonas sp. 25 TaxID=2302933 RepID=UPI0013D8340E|nr:hypothetical protein [Dysgonomonas sp. 25]